MGHGDDIIATGLARGAAARGKRIAFGDGKRIIWGPWSKAIFANNPNIAAPGDERAEDLEWVAYYKGHRVYNHWTADRWVWNYEFRAKPGEFFLHTTSDIKPDFIFIEPNVPKKMGTLNKDWGFENYQRVVDALPDIHFVQCDYGEGRKLRGVELLPTRNFLDAVLLLRRAALAIVPEGGLHHAAAAVGVPAIVIFGGWVPPQVLGYESHVNLTGGARRFCGSFQPCTHCREALQAITVDDVVRNV